MSEREKESETEQERERHRESERKRQRERETRWGSPEGVNGTNQTLHRNANSYRGTSLTGKRTPLGPYRRPMPRVLGGS